MNEAVTPGKYSDNHRSLEQQALLWQVSATIISGSKQAPNHTVIIFPGAVITTTTECKLQFYLIHHFFIILSWNHYEKHGHD